MTAIGAAGGISIVQDPREAEFSMMPTQAIRKDHVSAILPLNQLAKAMITLARGEPFSNDD